MALPPKDYFPGSNIASAVGILHGDVNINPGNLDMDLLLPVSKVIMLKRNRSMTSATGTGGFTVSKIRDEFPKRI